MLKIVLFDWPCLSTIPTYIVMSCAASTMHAQIKCRYEFNIDKGHQTMGYTTAITTERAGYVLERALVFLVMLS